MSFNVFINDIDEIFEHSVSEPVVLNSTKLNRLIYADDILLLSECKEGREEIASALNDFGNRWCKREYVEPDALKEWKVSIFKIVDQRIKFYSQNTNLFPPKP